MNAILLATALMVSALPVKAQEEPTSKEYAIYIYGYVFGSGGTLCYAVKNNQMTKDFAKRFFFSLTEELANAPNAPKSAEAMNAIKNAERKAMNDCEEVFK